MPGAVALAVLPAGRFRAATWAVLAVAAVATVALAAFGSVVGAVVGSVVILGVGLVARMPVLGWLVLFVSARSLSDSLLFSQNTSLAINVAMAGSIGVVAVWQVLARRVGRPVVAWIVLAALVVWAGVAFLSFGFDTSYVNDAARFGSIVLLALVARAAVREAGVTRMLRALTWATLPATFLIVVGGITTWSWLMSGSARSLGTFGHPNGAAAFAALGALLAFHQVVSTRSYWYLIPAISGALAVVLTESRGGQVALVVALLWYFVRGARVFWPSAKRAALVAAGVFASLAIAIALQGRWGEIFQVAGAALTPDAPAESGSPSDGAPSSPGQTPESSSPEGGESDAPDSLTWRFMNWMRFLQVWLERPVAGWGFGTTSDLINPIGQMPHSEFVRLLVEVGAVGFALAVAVCVASIIGVRRRLLGADTRTWVLLCSALVLVLVNALGANTISYVPTMFLFVAVWATGSVEVKAESEVST